MYNNLRILYDAFSPGDDSSRFNALGSVKPNNSLLVLVGDLSWFLL